MISLRSTLLITSFIFAWSNLFGQIDNINMSSTTTAVTCANTTNFYDNGGSSGEAGGNSTNYTHIFTSSTCLQITLTNLSFNSGSTLTINDSNGANLDVLDNGDNGSTVVLTSSGGSLTFIYSGANGGTNNGWSSVITCFTGDASFSLSATCTSITSTISGDTGGTFAFSTAPGDGAVIDSNTGEVTNVTFGTTYFVEYTSPCGGTSIESIAIPNGDASFSLTEICEGANATILGDIGGTFSFNPIPADGATINSSTGTVANGVNGTIYGVDYNVCGSTVTAYITVDNSNCFTLFDDGTNISVGGEDCIQLTAAANDQTGCAWSSENIDFTANFSLTLDYFFGNNPGGADGTTFTFMPNATGCGSSGAQLGAGGLSDALIIEFDTYDNDGGTNDDLSCDHIAIEIDGDLPDDPSNFPSNAAPLAGPICANSDASSIEDNTAHEVSIEWDAASLTLSIYFDGDLRLTCTNNFVANAFNGNSIVNWGATGATGGLNNQQYFCPSTVVVLPIELGTFESKCMVLKSVLNVLQFQKIVSIILF